MRLTQDQYVRVFSNDYSVDSRQFGRIVHVTFELDTVRVTRDGAIMATHLRIWARHLVLTDPVLVARATVMHRNFRTQTA